MLISGAVLDDYADNVVDTLHKCGSLGLVCLSELSAASRKNLLSLGEDRYLTTVGDGWLALLHYLSSCDQLLLKHFPTHTTKFTPDAIALTSAPEQWDVLLSQRRRWINSTVRASAALGSALTSGRSTASASYLRSRTYAGCTSCASARVSPDAVQVCCLSMRIFVFLDLAGTVLLPATTIYLVYLVVIVSTHQGAIPLISLIIIAARMFSPPMRSC